MGTNVHRLYQYDSLQVTVLRALVVTFALLLCVAFTSKSFAADTFPGGTLSGTGGSFVDTNVGTTGETGEPLTLGGGALNTQWYSWTAPASGYVTIGTCNPAGSTLTNFDTTVGIYTGSAVNALTQIGFNDDTAGCNSTVNPLYASTVAFNAVSGTIYRIQVDGYANTTGQFNLFYGFSGYTTAVTTATAIEAGATGAFTVVLNAVPTSAATITIGSSPQCTFSPTVLNFSSANWNVPQTVTVTANNDAIVEGTHFCAPASLTPSGGGVVASAAPPPSTTITDNDSATVSIVNTTNGAEAGPVNGVMTVTQSAVSVTNTVVSYTVTGTATSGTDYTALAGSITIPAGSTTATISIPVIDDAIVEVNETVIVTLNTVTSGTSTTVGTPAAATNTITSNDVSTVSIASITNGNETGPVAGVVRVTQTAVTTSNTVLTYTVSGTATSGSDFTALSGTVTITAGATTANINIPVINDILVEGNESVIITLTAVTSGLATLGAPLVATNTIADNDAPLVTIANTTNGNETGPVNGVFTVSQTAIPTTPIVIAYTVSGTATSGLDYTALSGTVTIPTGSTTATITVPVINDLIVEGNETVIVTLTAITSGAASLGATLIATNTIADNDSATMSIANTTNGAETGPLAGVLTVTQTNVSATDTVISYSIAGTATSGSDYTALSGTVTIVAGSVTATINIPVVDDAVLDAGETVVITLTSVTSGLPTLGSPVVATNTIADNDFAAFTISKSQTAGPSPVTAAGQAITYQVVITNTGSVPLTGTSFADTFQLGGAARSFTTGPTLTGDAAPTGIVNIGEAWTYTAIYTVPLADMNSTGSYTNDAVFDTAETPASNSNTVTTPVTRQPILTLNKTWSFAIPAHDVNGNGVADVGDIITYNYAVANTGNVTVTNVNISDIHLGAGTLSAISPLSVATLNPGAATNFTSTYLTVQGDIDNQ
jgi:Calx-beta domain